MRALLLKLILGQTIYQKMGWRESFQCKTKYYISKEYTKLSYQYFILNLEIKKK